MCTPLMQQASARLCPLAQGPLAQLVPCVLQKNPKISREMWSALVQQAQARRPPQGMRRSASQCALIIHPQHVPLHQRLRPGMESALRCEKSDTLDNVTVTRTIGLMVWRSKRSPAAASVCNIQFSARSALQALGQAASTRSARLNTLPVPAGPRASVQRAVGCNLIGLEAEGVGAQSGGNSRRAARPAVFPGPRTLAPANSTWPPRRRFPCPRMPSPS